MFSRQWIAPYLMIAWFQGVFICEGQTSILVMKISAYSDISQYFRPPWVD